MFHKSTSSGSSGEKGNSKTPADGPNVKKDKPKRQNSAKDEWATKASPPPELSRDVTEAGVFFEIPVPDKEGTRTVISGGTGALMVNEIIHIKENKPCEPAAFKEFVEKQLPNLNLVILTFKLLEKLDPSTIAKHQLLSVVHQLVKLSGTCKFKLVVDCSRMKAGPEDNGKTKEEVYNEQKELVKTLFVGVAPKHKVGPPVIVA